MDLTIREAASLLGRNERTLRAQIARGEIPARKHGSRWLIPRHSLPLTEAQRATLLARAEEVRAAVEDALPSRTAITPGQRRRSVADLDCFRAGREVVQAMRTSDSTTHAREIDELERALLSICEGNHAYHPPAKQRAFEGAREAVSRCIGLLLLGGHAVPEEPRLTWIVRLETEVLPSLAGLLRWCERVRRRA